MKEPLPKEPKELDSDIGYLPDVVLNEITRARIVHIVGGVNLDILTREEYHACLQKLRGKFGVVKFWRGNVANIATRPMPNWALELFERHRLEADECRRWVKS